MPPTLSTKSCWIGSEAVAAAIYEVARLRLAQVLTKEAALNVELAVNMMEDVESEDSELRVYLQMARGKQTRPTTADLRNFFLPFSKPLLT